MFVSMVLVHDDEILKEDVMDWKLNVSITRFSNVLECIFKVEKTSRDLRLTLNIRNG